MIVLHLSRSYGSKMKNPGGAEINLENLVKLISSRSNITSIIASDYGVWVKRKNEYIKKKEIYKNQFLFKSILKRNFNKIKVIHVHSNSYLIFIGFFIAFLLRARLIIKITRIGEQSLLSREEEKKSNLRLKVKKYLMQIICKSKLVYLQILTESGVSIARKISKNLIIFPNIIEEGIYQKEQKTNYSFLISSRLIKRKNIDIAIERIISLNKKEITIKIVGDGPQLKILREKYKSKNKFITFYGYLKHSEINNFYANSEYFINLSSSEGMSNSLIEAMSYGCKCIVTDIPENKDTAGSYAIYYKLNDDFIKSFNKAKCLDAKEVSIYANKRYALNSLNHKKLMELYKY